MKKADLSSILIPVTLLLVAVTAEAQQPKKVPRIGYLGGVSPSSNPARIDAFRQGCTTLGTRRGKISSSSGDTMREKSIAYPRSRLS